MQTLCATGRHLFIDPARQGSCEVHTLSCSKLIVPFCSASARGQCEFVGWYLKLPGLDLCLALLAFLLAFLVFLLAPFSFCWSPFELSFRYPPFLSLVAQTPSEGLKDCKHTHTLPRCKRASPSVLQHLLNCSDLLDTR